MQLAAAQSENTKAEDVIYNEELAPQTSNYLFMEHDNQDSY